MGSTSEIAKDLWQRTQSASTTGALDVVLRDIDRCEAAANLTPTDALAIARAAFSAAARISAEDASAARSLIDSFLLPRCVRTHTEASVAHKVASSNLRSLLADWIEQYRSPARDELREAVLLQLCRSLDTAPSKEAMWTLGAIGYRDERVSSTLWRVAERTDELGDSAISTLAGLGLNGEARNQLIARLGEKVSRGIRFGVLHALQELAGPEVLEMLLRQLSRPDLRSSLPKEVPFPFLVTLLSKSADTALDDVDMPDRAWREIRQHPTEAISSSEIAARCDTPETVIDYVRWIIESDSTRARPEWRHIYYQRLGDLVRPRQLAGWERVAVSELLPLLRKDACHDTKLASEFITTDVRQKVDAVETALMLGSDEPVQWLDDAVGQESGRYVQQMVLDVVASLRIDPLPRCIVELIREDLNVTAGEATSELFARTAAVRLAQSAGTREALFVLLECGLTYEGRVLRTTADAIADVALARVDAGDTDVPEQLLGRVFRGPLKRHRETAIGALCALAIHRKLNPDLGITLLSLFDDTSLKEHTRCRILEAIGFLPGNGSDRLDLQLISLTGVEGDIGFRAIEALIRRGQYKQLGQHVLRDRLGVRLSGDTWSIADPERINGWRAFLVGLLYQIEMQAFAPTIAAVLRHCGSDALSQVYSSVMYHGPNTPSIVADALVSRIYERFRQDLAETSLFDLLAKVAPSRLVFEDWAKSWKGWLPEGRIALCDAMRWVAMNTLRERARVITTLTTLAFDSVFAVRRAAFRALATADSEALASNCRKWAQSDMVDVRQRAAEAASWLPREAVNDDEIERIGLAADRERSVRAIAKRILPARRNRDWARDCLKHVLLVRTSDNQAILSAYRYGQALTKLGDDDIRRHLLRHAIDTRLPLHIVHWLSRLVKAIDQRWIQETREWPEPWIASEGAIEELDGKIIQGDGGSCEARFSLWCRWASGPSDLSEWGGVVYPADAGSGLGLFATGYVQIALPGRPAARALVSQQIASSNPAHQTLIIHGSGPYPQKVVDR